MSGVGGNREAWADFWSSGVAREGGCLPRALEAIDAAERALWQSFARLLPRKAQLLDLGTGDGTVLRKIQAVRPDLRLTGVDSSPRLPRPPAGATLMPDVAMEELPFPAAAFDAVTSQFGYEYGETAPAAREVARVLRPSGRLLFAVHRSDGPIVAHNRPRREALAWVLSPGGPVDKARALVGARRMAPLPTPPAFRAAPDDCARRFPGQNAGVEFLQALALTLDSGRGRPPEESLEVIGELERRARNEIARIESLERACCDQARIDALAGELRDAGLAVDEVGSLAEQGTGRLFAWLVSATR